EARALAARRRVSARARAAARARTALGVAAGTTLPALGVRRARLAVVGLADTAQARTFDPTCSPVRDVGVRPANRRGGTARDDPRLARLVVQLTRGPRRARDAGPRGLADPIGPARRPDRPVRAGVFANGHSPRAMCLAEVAGIARPAIHALDADSIPDRSRS